MKLLSIDWDYFFPVPEPKDVESMVLYDWGHQDVIGGFMLDQIWAIRGGAFANAGKELPGLSGEEEDFWPRFKFAPRSELFVSESHTNILDRQVFDLHPVEIWHFDAHHDGGGYHGETYAETLDSMKGDCGNWTFWYQSYADIKHYYPKWAEWKSRYEPEPLCPMSRRIDDGKPVDIVFDAVFLCRSGSWVPPWLDEAFQTFVDTCPAEFLQYIGEPIKRRRTI